MVAGSYPGQSYPAQGYPSSVSLNTILAPFIAATTTVYAPTLSGTGTATLTAPFIASTTVVYTPTVRRSGIGPQPLGVSIALDDPTLANAPTWTRLDA